MVPGHINHSDDELAFLSFYPLLRYETGSRAARRLQGEPGAKLADRAAGAQSALELHLRRRRPVRRSSTGTSRCARCARFRWIWSSGRSRTHTGWTCRSIRSPTASSAARRWSCCPYDELPMSKWNGNPYNLDGGNGGRSEDDGAYFLLPYWMGGITGCLKSRLSRWTLAAGPLDAGPGNPDARLAQRTSGQRRCHDTIPHPHVRPRRPRRRHPQDTTAARSPSTTSRSRCRPGEIFGLIGPNGAGKTTTMECVEGLRSPDRGAIAVLGLDPVRDVYRLQDRIGVQLQEAQLQKRIKVREAVDLWASLYRKPVDADRLLEQLGLVEKRNAWFMTLSGGQKQRLFIALALINDPGAGVPRRAHHRPRSAGAPGDLGAGARHPPARQDGLHDHAPHGRSRAAVRSGRGHRSRPDRRHRHAGGARPPPLSRADRDRHDRPRSRPTRCSGSCPA